jgi:hypothetical protein
MKPSPNLPVPWFVRAFAALFGVIGLTILGFLWFGTGDDFGAPPLFFKVFASLIASGFIIMGFGVAVTTGRGAVLSPSPESPRSGGTYSCPNCGGGLENADVSPSGDVKCSYCSRWFNIHASS